MWILILQKGLILHFCKNVLGYKFFGTPLIMILGGVRFFDTKARITQQNRKKSKIF